MRLTLLTTTCLLLFAASTTQAAFASRHHVHRTACAARSVSQDKRDAYGTVAWPSASESEREYWEGHGLSAPAGR
jgi:hypothetical protein